MRDGINKAPASEASTFAGGGLLPRGNDNEGGPASCKLVGESGTCKMGTRMRGCEAFQPNRQDLTAFRGEAFGDIENDRAIFHTTGQRAQDIRCKCRRHAKENDASTAHAFFRRGSCMNSSIEIHRREEAPVGVAFADFADDFGKMAPHCHGAALEGERGAHLAGTTDGDAGDERKACLTCSCLSLWLPPGDHPGKRA